jgi:hypothetical protein
MKSRAQKIWEAFKGELIDNGLKDSEDVRQALSTVLREIVDEFEYFRGDDSFGSMVVSSIELYDLAYELEKLDTL